MITGIHNLIYSANPEADRAFLRDVLGFPGIDTGGGWWIFALPQTEMGVHPPYEGRTLEMYLMCDDLDATMRELEARGALFEGEPQVDEGVGRFASIRLPGGGGLGIYQPLHATPLGGFASSQGRPA